MRRWLQWAEAAAGINRKRAVQITSGATITIAGKALSSRLCQAIEPNHMTHNGTSIATQATTDIVSGTGESIAR